MKNTEQRVEYHPARARISRSARDFLSSRGKNGVYRNNLRTALQAFCREPTGVSLSVFGVHLLRMLAGDRLTNAVLSDRTIVRTRRYDGGAPLFHFALTDNVEKILSSGLEPRDRFVYLTDAPQLYAQTFLPWKTKQIRASACYTLLRVDVDPLLKRQKVYCTDREHEFVTGKIDPRFLSIVPSAHVGHDPVEGV